MELHFQSVVALAEESTVAPGKPVIPLLATIRNLIRDEIFPAFEPFL
jgi:hypothetical protein